MAFEDALTRVGNRRFVDDVLDRLSGTAEQTAVALLDIDGLKQINDTRGHAAGDAAIRKVADILSTAAAGWPQAAVGRLGGDEFCVVLPACSLPEALALLDTALPALRAAGGPTVSKRVAVSGSATWSPRSLLAAADESLYRAKRDAHTALEREDRRQARQPSLRRRPVHHRSPP